jgi:hypothetical protein
MEGISRASRSDRVSVRSSLLLSLCWQQLGPIWRLLKTAAPFPYGRGPRAWSGISSNRVRSWGVTTANRPFANFKRGSRSCGNSSKETPTAAPERQPTSTAAPVGPPALAPAEHRGAITLSTAVWVRSSAVTTIEPWLSTTSQSDFSQHPYPPVPDMARRPAAKNRTMPERGVLPARREGPSTSARHKSLKMIRSCRAISPIQCVILSELSRLATRALGAPYIPWRGDSGCVSIQELFGISVSTSVSSILPISDAAKSCSPLGPQTGAITA